MNGKLKIKSAVLQGTALLLFFALAFGATAASAGLFGNAAKDNGGGSSPLDQFFSPSPPRTEEPGVSTEPSIDPENPSGTIQAGYVQNLSSAFNTGMIEGYTNDRSSVPLSKRVELYNRLTASMGTVDTALSPAAYQTYSSDAYLLAKRLSLDYDYLTGTEIITEYSKLYSDFDGSYKTVANPYLVGRKTVQPYMGYLLISRVETRQVLVTKPPVTTTAPVTTPPATTFPETSGNTPQTTTPATTTTPPVTTPVTTPEPDPITTPVTTPVVTPETTPVVTPETTPETPVTTDPETPSESGGGNVPAPEESGSSEEETPAPVTAGSTTVLPTPDAEPSSAVNTLSAGSAASIASVTSATSAASASEEEPRYETVEVTVLSLYDSKGKLLIDDIGDKEPYYARDYSNRPVFVDSAGKLYAFDGTKFISVTKEKLRQFLFYDYPAYPLGTYNNVYEAHYSASRGGYNYINYTNSRTLMSTTYFRTFNFASNGLAVVVAKTDNTLQIINTGRKQAFKPGSQYRYNTGVDGHRQNVKDYYMLPDTLGIESIGSTGYDNGWLRLRIQIRSVMNDSFGTVVKDYEVLVDSKGNKFNIPEGYTLEGYSDGVLLLSKDGLYGYYSISGDWIAQPIYTYARPFVQGLAVVGSETGTVGMIDTKGNIVLPFVYTSISDISSGVITTYCEGIGWETYEMIAK